MCLSREFISLLFMLRDEQLYKWGMIFVEMSILNIIGRTVAHVFLSYRVGNLSPTMGRGMDSRNRAWNWVAKLHRLAGLYYNPMPTGFLAPTAGPKLPTLAVNQVTSGELWARIFKRLWSPGTDSKEWIPPASVAWLAGTITLLLLDS